MCLNRRRPLPPPRPGASSARRRLAALLPSASASMKRPELPFFASLIFSLWANSRAAFLGISCAFCRPTASPVPRASSPHRSSLYNVSALLRLGCRVPQLGLDLLAGHAETRLAVRRDRRPGCVRVIGGHAVGDGDADDRVLQNRVRGDRRTCCPGGRSGSPSEGFCRDRSALLA